MSKYQYEDAVKQLQESGAIGLVDLKSLPHDDLNELFEEMTFEGYFIVLSSKIAWLITLPNVLYSVKPNPKFILLWVLTGVVC